MSLFQFIRKLRIRITQRHSPFTTKLPGFLCSAPDKSSFLAMYEEIYERKIYNLPSHKKNPYFIDCGANIGLATIYLKQHYPNAKIVAFEPDKNIYTFLQENIKHSEVGDNVTLINKGLWSEETTLSFLKDGSDGGKIVVNQLSSSPSSTIETTKLSTYLNQEVDFLKIDIEGAEDEVLRECASKLSNVMSLFIEYHSDVKKNPQTLSNILSILSHAGFRYYIESVGIYSTEPLHTISTDSGFDNQLNIFAYRPKMHTITPLPSQNKNTLFKTIKKSIAFILNPFFRIV